MLSSVFAPIKETVDNMRNNLQPALVITATEHFSLTVPSKSQALALYSGTFGERHKQETIRPGKRRRPASPAHPATHKG